MQTFYHGASFRAMHVLGKLRGYTIVATDKLGVNIFFVRTDILTCQGVQASVMLLSTCMANNVQGCLLCNLNANPCAPCCQILQPVAYEKLYNRASYAWPHRDETNRSREWLYLDDQLNVVKRQFLHLPL